jgi:DNA (cytosine-5)-methyltransferase 1
MLKFIDLFSGIGGFRLAFEVVGAKKCLFSADINKHACATYEENFNYYPLCDVSKVEAKDIHNFKPQPHTEHYAQNYPLFV